MQKKRWDQVPVPRNHVSWAEGSTLSLEGSDTFFLGYFEEDTALTHIWKKKKKIIQKKAKTAAEGERHR